MHRIARRGHHGNKVHRNAAAMQARTRFKLLGEGCFLTLSVVAMEHETQRRWLKHYGVLCRQQAIMPFVGTLRRLFIRALSPHIRERTLTDSQGRVISMSQPCFSQSSATSSNKYGFWV